jgi:hypothetical protein
MGLMEKKLVTEGDFLSTVFLESAVFNGSFLKFSVNMLVFDNLKWRHGEKK